MAFIIANFILCLIGAVVFGFIFGWILSSLIRNEKLHDKLINIQDNLDKKSMECEQLSSNIEDKELETDQQRKEYFILKKELMKKEMDIEECENKKFTSDDEEHLKLENKTLKEEIKEYRLIEESNENLKIENDFLDTQLTKAEKKLDKFSKETEEYKTISKGSTSLIQTNQALQERNKANNKVIKIVHANIQEIEKKIEKIQNINNNKQLDIPLLEIEKTVQTIDEYISVTTKKL